MFPKTRCWEGSLPALRDLQFLLAGVACACSSPQSPPEAGLQKAPRGGPGGCRTHRELGQGPASTASHGERTRQPSFRGPVGLSHLPEEGNPPTPEQEHEVFLLPILNSCIFIRILFRKPRNETLSCVPTTEHSPCPHLSRSYPVLRKGKLPLNLA